MPTSTYLDPCPICGERLVAYSKEEYMQHLRSNGHEMMAEFEEHLMDDDPGINGTLAEILYDTSAEEADA